MSEADYRLRESEALDAQHERWLSHRAGDLRDYPYQLVKALNEIHGEDLFACLHTLVTASSHGTTPAVIEGWITMVLQDEEARGEWRNYDA